MEQVAGRIAESEMKLMPCDSALSCVRGLRVQFFPCAQIFRRFS